MMVLINCWSVHRSFCFSFIKIPIDHAIYHSSITSFNPSLWGRSVSFFFVVFFILSSHPSSCHLIILSSHRVSENREIYFYFIICRMDYMSYLVQKNESL